MPLTKEFSGFMGDSICTKTAVVNIGSISKDEFPKVVARVQVQSDEWKTIEELREHIKVYDCGAEITDFAAQQNIHGHLGGVGAQLGVVDTAGGEGACLDEGVGAGVVGDAALVQNLGHGGSHIHDGIVSLS